MIANGCSLWYVNFTAAVVGAILANITWSIFFVRVELKPWARRLWDIPWIAEILRWLGLVAILFLFFMIVLP